MSPSGRNFLFPPPKRQASPQDSCLAILPRGRPPPHTNESMWGALGHLEEAGLSLLLPLLLQLLLLLLLLPRPEMLPTAPAMTESRGMQAPQMPARNSSQTRRHPSRASQQFRTGQLAKVTNLTPFPFP